jgi:AcrR family transcriptional regulator
MTGDGVAIGLRERKKLETRQALEDVALRLFAEKGFDHVTVEEIAAAAGVSSRTFFRYFRSKEDVALGPALELHRLLLAALDERPPGEPVLDVLRHAVERLARHLEELRPQLLLRLRIIRTTPALAARGVQLREDWRGLMVQEAANRLAADPATDLRPHVAAMWALAAMSAAREVWEDGPPSRDLPSLVDEAYRLLLGDLSRALTPAAT